MNDLEYFRSIYCAANCAVRNYMHALSDYADFRYREKYGPRPVITIESRLLAQRVFEADREMLRQESILHIVAKESVITTYAETVELLREFRKMVDHGTESTATYKVHPEDDDWKEMRLRYQEARRKFADESRAHLHSLSQCVAMDQHGEG